jgi:hypothetical protein
MLKINILLNIIMPYSYVYGTYFYRDEIVDMIKTVRIERQAKKDNKLRLMTTFAEDLLTLMGEVPPPE